MKTTSDLEVSNSLETLAGLITGGIEKVEALLQDVWDEDTFVQTRTELAKTTDQLQQSRDALIENQHKSIQERESLESVMAVALAQKTSLEQSGTEYKQLCANISMQAQRGQTCLSSLTNSIQQAEQTDRQISAALQRVETAQREIIAVDQKYQAAVKLKTQIAEVVELMGDRTSFEALILSINTATAKLQSEQESAQSRIQAAIEPTDRRLNRLIEAQRAPWWWPSNWWWKTKASFTTRRMPPEPAGSQRLPGG